MSVAERVPHDESTAAHASAPASAIDNILRLALRNVTASRPPVPQPRKGEPDFGMAASLLDRATTTIAALTTQRDDLQRTVAHQDAAFARQQELFLEKLTQLQTDGAEWERRAKIGKEQLAESENRLAQLQAHVEALTERAEQVEARLALAEQATRDARQQAQMYHDRIIDAFGELF